jgi:hypothetical protein
MFVALPIHQAYFSALLWISLFSVLFFDGYHLGCCILESDNISPAGENMRTTTSLTSIAFEGGHSLSGQLSSPRAFLPPGECDFC